MIVLGCIADDFTGATDLANNLVRAGMRVVLTVDVPARTMNTIDADAVVVALKSRTVPAADAVEHSLVPAVGCADRARGRSISKSVPPLTPQQRATSGRSSKR